MNEKEFKLVIDQKTIDYLTLEVKQKRAAGRATSFGDIFLIRLTESLNKGLDSQVFKVKHVNR